MVQRASPGPSADRPEPQATLQKAGAEDCARGELARQRVERGAELQDLQRRLQAEIEERSRVECALRDSEARARQAEVRLRQALESISEGFVLWDADDRLVLCNQRYRDLYAAVADSIRPGIGFAELMLRLAEQGYVPEAIGREAAWVAERAQLRRAQAVELVERRHADGRWLRICSRRTPEGGIVTVHSDVTELKRQAEDLREREAQLRGIVDNIPIVIYRRVRHPDGRISYPYHSPQLELRHGFDPAEVARDASLLLDAVHPEDRAAWLAAIEDSAERLTPFGGDYRILMRGGGFHWFRTIATPTRQDDGTVVWDGVSIDITGLKATEQALRASETRYRHLIEAGPVAFLTQRAGRVTFANARALELFGTRTPADLIGRPFAFLIHPDDRRTVHAGPGHEGDSEEPPEPCEIRILRLDGGTTDVEAMFVPIIDADGEPSMQVVLLDITERKRADQRVRHLAHHDPLTGLPNRALLLDRLHQALVQARRERSRIAVLMLDLDHFKTVNDTFGHTVGDRLLCAVADRLRTTVRESDTLARFGGDEFTLVQTGLGEPNGASVLAQKVVDALADPFPIGDQEMRTTTSAGVAIYPEHGAEFESLLEHADIALYRAKADGRNRAVVFIDSMKADLQARGALAGGRLEPVGGAHRPAAAGARDQVVDS